MYSSSHQPAVSDARENPVGRRVLRVTMRPGMRPTARLALRAGSPVPMGTRCWHRGGLMDLQDRVIKDRYIVGTLLGEGGDAIVYRAWDRALRRMVALKLLRPELRADPTFVTR